MKTEKLTLENKIHYLKEELKLLVEKKKDLKKKPGKKKKKTTRYRSVQEMLELD